MKHIDHCNCANNNYMNNGECLSCPEGSTSTYGSKHIDHCNCAANFFMNNAECQSCPQGSTSTAGSKHIDHCNCAANTYMEDGECEWYCFEKSQKIIDFKFNLNINASFQRVQINQRLLRALNTSAIVAVKQDIIWTLMANVRTALKIKIQIRDPLRKASAFSFLFSGINVLKFFFTGSLIRWQYFAAKWQRPLEETILIQSLPHQLQLSQPIL